MQSLWEHATVQMPPNLDALPAVLDELANRFGGELLYLMPTQVHAAVQVPGRLPVVTLWTLVLRFPVGQRAPALAWANIFGREPPADDVAGAQALTLDDRALQAAFARE